MTTSKRTTRRNGGAQSGNGDAAHAEAAAPKAAKPRTRRPKAAASAASLRQDRHASIAMAAYFRSQMRGFEPGYELEDWLAAEAEVNQRVGQ